MGTKVGFIYSTDSKIIRRIVVPTNDRDLESGIHVGPGESMAVADKKDGVSVERAAQVVQQVTGVNPPSARCAILDKDNKVVGVVMADPVLDGIAGHEIKKSDEADIGWEWNAQRGFEKPIVEPVPVEEEAVDFGVRQ